MTQKPILSHLKTFAHGENFTSPQVKLHFCYAKTSLAAHAANFTRSTRCELHRSAPFPLLTKNRTGNPKAGTRAAFCRFSLA